MYQTKLTCPQPERSNISHLLSQKLQFVHVCMTSTSSTGETFRDVMTTIIAMRSILEGGKTCEPTSTSWEDNLLLINYNFVAWSGCSNALYFQSVLCWIWIRSVQCWLIITLPLPSPLPIPNHQLPHLLCTFHFPAFSLHISIIVTFPADFMIIPCIPPLHPSPTSPTVYVDMPFPSLPQALP